MCSPEGEGGVSVQGESLSMGFSIPEVSVQGHLCPGAPLFRGSLSRGSLSRGSLSKGVSVQGVSGGSLSRGSLVGLCPGGLCLVGLCPGGSLSERPPLIR